MIVHGSANVIAGTGKMIATTLDANANGTASADKMNADLPGSALGMVAVGVTGGNKMAGTVGDLLDVGVSLPLGAAASKSTDIVLDLAKLARQAGETAAPEQMAVAELAKQSTPSIVGNAVVDVTGQVMNAQTVADGASKMEKEYEE